MWNNIRKVQASSAIVCLHIMLYYVTWYLVFKVSQGTTALVANRLIRIHNVI